MTDQSARGGWDPIVAPWHVDEHLPAFPSPVGAVELPWPGTPAATAPARMDQLHALVADAAAQAARPLVLSGDCPTARGTVAGLQRRHRDLAVVWLDAHGDYNTPAISVSGYLGGMALAMLTGRTTGLFGVGLGLRPVAEAAVVLADARDLDPAERDALAAGGVRRVPADAEAITAALDGLGHVPVYLHLDIDVIDGAQLPGARFPSGPGPSVADIEECLAAVCAATDVVAAGIACAWLPDQFGNRTTRETIGRLTGALGADLEWPDPTP